jgi:outer membrane protein TolC
MALVVYLAATQAQADGPDGVARARRVTLLDVLTVTLRQNPALAAATIDLEAAAAGMREARGADDRSLEVRAKGAMIRNEAAPGQVYQQLEVDNAGIFTRLRWPIRAGGNLALRFDGEYRRSMTRLDTDTGRQDAESKVFAPTVGLELTQPLLRGAGARVARASERHAYIQHEASYRSRQAVASGIVRDVVRAYWEVAFAARALEIRRASVNLAREHLGVVQVAIDAGSRSRSGSSEVEVELANREEDLLVAESALYARSLELRRLVGLEIGLGEIALQPVDDASTVVAARTPPDLDEALERALAGSPELETMRARGRAAPVDLELARDALRPQLDLTLSVRAAGNATGVTESVHQMASYRGLAVEGALVFTMPIGGTRDQAAADSVAARVRKAKVEEAELAAKVTVDVTRAVQAVRIARKRVEVQARSADLARGNLAVEHERYEAGSATTFDVLRRQNELAEAQLRQAKAAIDCLEAEADLEALTGNLLARYAINLPAT